MTYECAIVPTGVSPYRAAATFDVPAAPAMAAARAAFMAGVDAVVAARREVDDCRSGRRRREHEPCRLRGDRGLEVDLVEQQRLQQLRLDPRCR